MMREVSYAGVFVPKLQRLIEVCNEVGNRSFVWKTENADDVRRLGSMTKIQKDAYLETNPQSGTALVMRAGWEEMMRTLLITNEELKNPSGAGVAKLLSDTRTERLSFEKRIEELKAWRKKNPDTWPPSRSSLGEWLKYARKKLQKNKCTPEQAAALEVLGVKPAERQIEERKTTDERIAELKTWHEMNRYTWPHRKSSLGMWLKYARKKLQENKYTQEQTAALEALGVKAAEHREESQKN